MLSALASFESERFFNKNGESLSLTFKIDSSVNFWSTRRSVPKASETCKLSFLSILINVWKEICLYDITICWSSSPWKNGTAFFTRAIEKILVVDQWLIHVKARKPVWEWNFIEKTLRYYNFGDSLITWVKLFYKEISSCIQNNGWSSAFFNLTRGVRQGRPLSPYLFIHVLKLWETP